MYSIFCSLSINGTGLSFEAHPIFNDDLKLELTSEENQVFKRYSLDGTVKFIGPDFDFLVSCDESVKFTLTVKDTEYIIGTQDFYLTDCTLDYDNKVAALKLKTKDRYEKILNGLANEYNLIKLAPKAKEVSYKIKSMLQLYVLGDSKITNILGHCHYEQDCNTIDNAADLVNAYHFLHIGLLSAFTIEPEDIVNTELAEAVGTYNLEEISFGSIGIGLYTQSYVNTNGKYKIAYSYSPSLGKSGVIFQTVSTGEQTEATSFTILLQDGEQYLLKNGDTDCFYFTYHEAGDLYGRVVSPIKKTGFAEYEISSTEDICSSLPNFKYCGGYLDVAILTSKIKSPEPTEYGIDGEGSYFTAPMLSSEEKASGDRLVPVAQSYWESMSFFIRVDSSLVSILENSYTRITVRDTYYLADIIHVLIAKIDDSIKFEIDSDTFSNFLNISTPNSSNVILGYPFPRSRNNVLCLAPASNIKKTNYEQAAQRGNISLEQVFSLLRNLYQVYWCIDENNYLHIEHLAYFKNGLSYLEDFNKYDIDITGQECLPAKKNWAYGTNNIEYAVDKLPARYEFSYSAPSAEVFNGYPIEIKESFLGSAQTEKIEISNVIADIDMLTAFPDQYSDDLWVLLEVSRAGGYLSDSSVRLSDTAPLFFAQNIFASLLFAEKNYYLNSLSGFNAKIEDTLLPVESTTGIKKQKFTFPLTYTDTVKSIRNIKTGLGVGEVDSLSIKLGSQSCEATIIIPNSNNYKHLVSFNPLTTFSWLTNKSDKLLVANYITKGADSYSGIKRVILSPKVPSKISATDIVVLNTSVVSNVIVSRFYNKTIGHLKLTERATTTSQVLIISGDKRSELTFGYVRIYAKESVKITMTANSLQGSHVGYIALNPIHLLPDIGNAIATVSGTESIEYTLAAGNSIFAGYIKNSYEDTSEDKVTFTITK